jgi:hypothetical protein
MRPDFSNVNHKTASKNRQSYNDWQKNMELITNGLLQNR